MSAHKDSARIAGPLAPVAGFFCSPPTPQIMFTSAFNSHHCQPCEEQVSADYITSSGALLKGKEVETPPKQIRNKLCDV